MEWIDALRGTVVGVDTAPFIYLIEENQTYLSFVQPFFEAADRGEFRIVTSVPTLTEVLVHPMRQGPALAPNSKAQSAGEVLENAQFRPFQ